MYYATCKRAVEAVLRWGRWQAYSRVQRLRGALRRRGDPAASPGRQIVVCGFPRGGTSLIYNMLSASLDGFHFAEFEVPARKFIARWGDCASKMPLDVLHLRDLVELNIHGKRLLAIVMLRDPRDLITSVHPNVPDRYFLDYDGSWTPHRRGPRRQPFGIRSVYDAVEQARYLHGIEVIFVRYEDLVGCPDRVQEELAARMGLRFSSRFSEFHNYPQRHAYRYSGRTSPKDHTLVRENSAVDHSRQGKWRRPEHAARIVHHFSEHPGLFELVRQLGYEEEDSWFTAEYCDGGPLRDLTTSRFPASRPQPA